MNLKFILANINYECYFKNVTRLNCTNYFPENSNKIVFVMKLNDYHSFKNV